VCQVCAESVTDDIFKCNWCEGIKHANCTKLSSEQCNVFSNVNLPLQILCSFVLPVLIQHDTQVYIDFKFTTLEKSLTEIQQAEKKLSDSVHSIELQFEKHQKSIVFLLESKIQVLTKDTADYLQTFGNTLDKHLTNLTKMHPSEPTAEPSSPLSANSVYCITFSIAYEQHERAKQ